MGEACVMHLALRPDAGRCNARLKVFPDGQYELMVSSKRLWGDGSGADRGEIDLGEQLRPRMASAESPADRARRRARAAVRDYALGTPGLDTFVTLTCDAQKVDRYDPAAILARYRGWLGNRVARRGLAYVLVPELHKDGAIHFHGLMSGAALQLRPSGTYLPPPQLREPGKKARPRRARSQRQAAEWERDGWQSVANIADYGLGFSTAIPLTGDRARAVGYICKYIGKGSEKVGGRWYYSGGALQRPVEYVFDFDPRGAGVEWDYEFAVPAAGADFRVLRGRFGDPDTPQLTVSGLSTAARGPGPGGLGPGSPEGCPGESASLSHLWDSRELL